MAASVSARELKNRTGEILRRVRRGEQIQVTNRGKVVAFLVPPSDMASHEGDPIRPYDEAWQEITTTLAESSPQYGSWREAVDRSRRRS